MSETPSWEEMHDWSLVRPIVYYQRENFVPDGIVSGADVTDFSAGLGDLSAYVASLGPAHIRATVPEAEMARPQGLPEEASWVTGVGAGDILSKLGAGSTDVVLARMIIQFPTVEQHNVDVDDMLTQWHTVLRNGGSLVASTHAFFSLPQPPVVPEDADEFLTEVEKNVLRVASDDQFGRQLATRTTGLIELIRYLGLPPREGPLGETGFGLKIPMLVNSFLRCGYALESVEMIEPFTFPIGLNAMLSTDRKRLFELGEEVIEVKRRYLTSDANRDPYHRPRVVSAMLAEIERKILIVAVPIVRIHGRKV